MNITNIDELFDYLFDKVAFKLVDTHGASADLILLSTIESEKTGIVLFLMDAKDAINEENDED